MVHPFVASQVCHHSDCVTIELKPPSRAFKRKGEGRILGVLRIRTGADRRQRRFRSAFLGWIRLRALRILGTADPDPDPGSH